MIATVWCWTSEDPDSAVPAPFASSTDFISDFDQRWRVLPADWNASTLLQLKMDIMDAVDLSHIDMNKVDEDAVSLDASLSAASARQFRRDVIRRFHLQHRVLFLLRLGNNDYKSIHSKIERFMVAASTGDVGTVEELIAKSCIDGGVRTRAFKKACEFGHVGVVERLLLEQGVVPNAQYDWAIRVAAANNHVDLLDRLLALDDVDATARNNWALVRAAERGHACVVERLLSVPGIDPGARNNWSIIKAAENGQKKACHRAIGDAVSLLVMANDCAQSKGQLWNVDWAQSKGRL